MGRGILYISYDGMLEPLGQSQVLAYLEKLAPGRSIQLISFEKPNDWADRERRKAVARRIAGAGISWHPMRYHKSPSAPATAYDIAAGTVRAVAIAKANRIGIVHARSYVAGVMALAVKRMTGAPFLFDMRGLWADERVEGGVWPAGSALYRGAKAVERRLFAAADHIVTLTHASEAELQRIFGNGTCALPISVIPTCADLERFTIATEPQRDPFVLGYVGSVENWYLLDEMLQAYRIVRDFTPSAQLLIINHSEHEVIRARLRALEIDESRVEVLAAEHRDVPAQITRMSAGMAFYKPTYSRIACAPTKLAEYLSCGIFRRTD